MRTSIVPSGKSALAASVLASVAMLGFSSPFAHAGSAGPGPIVNPFSNFPIEADGAYTNPTEWSDITPAWFISSIAGGTTPTFAGDPAANSLLFAGLAHDSPTSPAELYLMYDYLPRTAAPSAPNEFLGNVSFPLTIATQGSGGLVTSHSANITVQLQTSSTFPTPDNGTTSPFDVLVDLHDGNGFAAHPELHLEAGVGLGNTPVNPLWGVVPTSPFHTTLHELLELGVPLDIPAGFATPGGPLDNSGARAGGGGGGGYSPDPAFWNSNLPKNPGDADPPASGGVFQILPNGSTTIIPIAIPNPEPTTLGLVAVGGVFLSMRRARKRR